MPIKPIDLEYFNRTGHNIHECIVAASKRARMVNDDIKIEFNQRIELITTKTETENEENDINPDQLKVSLEFEKKAKPTDVALDELMSDKLHWHFREKEEPLVVKEDDTPETDEA
jgi:hypothetical protein